MSIEAVDIVPSACVYVLANPAMPGIYKIGRSSRDPFIRAAELSAATGVPAPFHRVMHAWTSDGALVESELHDLLSEFRVTTTREFFRCPIEIIVLSFYFYPRDDLRLDACEIDYSYAPRNLARELGSPSRRALPDPWTMPRGQVARRFEWAWRLSANAAKLPKEILEVVA